MPKLPDTHTAMKLARELQKVGLVGMAEKAAEGYYHDFLSPLNFPEMQLLEDLKKARSLGYVAADRLIEMHMKGEFDASLEESEEWEAGPEGQAALAALTKGKPPSSG